MNILAPLRTIGEVAPLIKAGADEFYCGIAPAGWGERFGNAWANRRDPRSASVPDEEELGLMVAEAGERPLFVTLNSPHYPPGAVEFLTDFGCRLIEDNGVSALIVADLDLALSLVEAGHADRLHLSSLATCTNPGAAKFYRELGLSRIVLPRHMTLTEISETVVDGVEFEAFLLNDGCVFEEGLCATTHEEGTFCRTDGCDAQGLDDETLGRYEFWKWTLTNCGCRTSRGYPIGPCALCAIPALTGFGIKSLKVVGREASMERKVSSVALAAVARNMAWSCEPPEKIREAVIELRGAKELCRDKHICYYPDMWEEAKVAGC